MELGELFTLTNMALTSLVLVCVYVLYMSRHHRFFQRMGIKGPSPVPLFGTFTKMLSMGGIDFDRECYAKYKKDGFYGTYDMSFPVLMVTDLDAIKEITIRQFQNFADHRKFEGLNTFPSTHFLTMMNGDHWKHVRGLLTPAFSSGKLKQMIPMIQDCCDELSEVLQKAAENGEDVELKKIIGNLTMDVIARTGFGLQTDAQKNPDNQFVQSAKAFFSAGGVIILSCFFFPFLAPLLKLLKFQPVARKHIHFFTDATLHALRERHSDKTKYNDLVQLMANAEVDLDAEVDNADPEMDPRASLTTSTRWTNKGLTNEDIIGSGIVFIVAGYETTATTICFALHELAMNPECLAKAQKEIDDKLKGGKPTHETLCELTYLEMCINETLRVYPPAFRTDRLCLETTVVNSVTIPKDMVINIPVAAIHKDPEIWPEPDRFIPERFKPEVKANRHPLSFIPFGIGPRNCIGMRLAMIETKMALANILQKFIPVRGEKTEVPLKLIKFGLTGPVNGFWLKIKSRR